MSAKGFKKADMMLVYQVSKYQAPHNMIGRLALAYLAAFLLMNQSVEGMVAPGTYQERRSKLRDRIGAFCADMVEDEQRWMECQEIHGELLWLSTVDCQDNRPTIAPPPLELEISTHPPFTGPSIPDAIVLPDPPSVIL